MMISLLLTVWASSLFGVRFQVNSFGIFGGFPFYYFVSVGLLLALAIWQGYYSQTNRYLLPFAWMFTFVSLNVIPTLIGGVTRNVTGALSFQWQVTEVMAAGHLSPVASQLYLNGGDPGFIYFFAPLYRIIGGSSITFATQWVFIFWQLFYLPFLLIIGLKTLGRKQMWLLPTFFLLYQWLSFNSVDPQTIGFAAFLILVTVMVALPPRDFRTLIIFTLLTILVSTSHGLSSLFAVAFVFVLSVVRKDVPRRYPLLFAVVFGSWLLFGSTQLIVIGVPSILSYLSNPSSIIYLGLFARVASPNTGHQLLGTIRSLYSASFLFTGLVGLACILRFRRGSFDKTQLSIFIGLTLVTGLVGYGYGAEILDKTLLFASPLVGYLALQTLHYRRLKLFLLLLLIVSPGVYMISAYGDQYSSTVPSGVFSALGYFSSHAPGGGIVSGNLLLWGAPVFQASTPYLGPPIGYNPVPIYLPNSSRYSGITYEKLESSNLKPVEAPTPLVVAISVTDKELYVWNYGNSSIFTVLQNKLNRNLNLVFDCPDTIYWYGSSSP